MFFHTTLAQASLNDVPDSFWKNFSVVLIVLIVVASAIAGIWAVMRKPSPVKLDDQPPIEVRKSPKRFNYEQSEQRYHDHERRIVALERAHLDTLKRMDDIKDQLISAGDQRGFETRGEINNVRVELDKKIDALPDRVIATLRNTGAI